MARGLTPRPGVGVDEHQGAPADTEGAEERREGGIARDALVDALGSRFGEMAVEATPGVSDDFDHGWKNVGRQGGGVGRGGVPFLPRIAADLEGVFAVHAQEHGALVDVARFTGERRYEGPRLVQLLVALTRLFGVVERIGVQDTPDELARDVLEPELEVGVLEHGVVAALEAAPWVHVVERDGLDRLRVTVASVDLAESELVRTLADAGARVVGIAPAEVDLEHVFLELTG